jgi:hypothetical protein
MGQKARATPAVMMTTATSTPPAVGRDRRASTPTINPPATEPIWPPRQPAITPRRSNGEKR